MKNSSTKHVDGTVPRASTNKFAAIFLKRGKSNSMPVTEATASERDAAKQERDTPARGSTTHLAPLRAAKGDDDLMSQPPRTVKVRNSA